MRHAPLGRMIPIALLATTGLIGGSSSASAADSFNDLPAGTACSGFGVTLSVTGDNRDTRIFKDRAGNVVRTITAGTGGAVTFTSYKVPGVTLKTVSFRSYGAVQKTVPNADGTTTWTATGHLVLILFPTDSPQGPSTTLIAGRTVFNVVDKTGVFTVKSVTGKSTDICALLAP